MTYLEGLAHIIWLVVIWLNNITLNEVSNEHSVTQQHIEHIVWTCTTLGSAT